MKGLTEEIDRLINEAISLCHIIDTASPPYFQRMLMIDWDTALLVFDELVKAEIIINIRKKVMYGEVNYIGEIDKVKLAKFSKN